MTMEVQGLIDRIQADGVQKAEAQKQAMIEAAEKEAKSIIANAKEEAAEMIKVATDESQKLEARAKSAVSQAARDMILGLRVDMENRLKKVVKSNIDSAMTADVMKNIITQLVAGSKDASGVEIALPKAITDADIQSIKSAVSASYKSEPEIMLRSDFSAGFKVGFKDTDLFLDISDEALTQIICGYVGPKIAAIIESK